MGESILEVAPPASGQHLDCKLMTDLLPLTLLMLCKLSGYSAASLMYSEFLEP